MVNVALLLSQIPLPPLTHLRPPELATVLAFPCPDVA
jgi:hypothetical protein